MTIQDIKELKEVHENIRTILMNNGADEYGDCIIDEICCILGVPTTTIYYDYLKTLENQKNYDNLQGKGYNLPL